jgi:HAD superfamily phosphoserine phosphatase-like hydrolase
MPILVTDFDGTFTRRDFFDLILERHDPPGARESWQGFLDGRLTHAQGIGGVFAALRTDESGVEALIAALDPAPGTAAAVGRLQQAGWEIVVASAGCGWYIKRLLAELGLELTVHASPGTFSPETGIVMTPDPAGPYFDPESGIDKPAVVRAALVRDPIVAYAGDSNTDRAGALLVPPERRFITGWLGRRLVKEEVPHVPFGVWPEIAAHLLDENSP